MKKKLCTLMLIFLAVTMLLSVFSFGYELPQKHSSDSYTDPIPEVVIPDFPEQEGILVYFNAVQVPVEIAPVYEKNVLYLPLGELYRKILTPCTDRPLRGSVFLRLILGNPRTPLRR